MGDDRPSAYREDKLSIYRVSAMGGCLTALVASILEYEPDRASWAEEVLGVSADEGNYHEPDILRRLREDEKMRVWGGQDQGGEQLEMNWMILPGIVLRGHPDGFAKLPRGRKEHLVEAKTMSENVYKKWVLYPDFETALLSPDFIKYGWQISGYMLNYGMPAVYAVKNRNTGKMVWAVIDAPLISEKQIKKKLIQAEKWRMRGEPPPCMGDASERGFCEFPYLHAGEFGNEDDDFLPDEDFNETHFIGMCDLRMEYSKTEQAGKVAEKERKELDQKIRTEIPGKKLVVGEYTAKIIDGSTRPILNHSTLFLKLREAIIEGGGGRVPKGALDWLTPERLKGLIDESSTPKKYQYLKLDKKTDKK